MGIFLIGVPLCGNYRTSTLAGWVPLFLENKIIELLPGTLSGGGYPFFLKNWIIELLPGSNLGWWCPFFREPENTGKIACGYYPGS